MYICAGYNLDQDVYILCQIQYIIVDDSFTELNFCGLKRKVFYDLDSGLFRVECLLDTGNVNADNGFISVDANNLATIEPVIHCKFESSFKVFVSQCWFYIRYKHFLYIPVSFFS